MGPVMTCGPGAPQNFAGGWTPGWVPSRAPHCASQMSCSSRGTSCASRGIAPGSPLTVQRCTTSPLRTVATGACVELHLRTRERERGRGRCVVVGERAGCVSSSDRSMGAERDERRTLVAGGTHPPKCVVSGEARTTCSAPLAARANATRPNKANARIPARRDLDCAQSLRAVIFRAALDDTAVVQTKTNIFPVPVVCARSDLSERNPVRFVSIRFDSPHVRVYSSIPISASAGSTTSSPFSPLTWRWSRGALRPSVCESEGPRPREHPRQGASSLTPIAPWICGGVDHRQRRRGRRHLTRRDGPLGRFIPLRVNRLAASSVASLAPSSVTRHLPRWRVDPFAASGFPNATREDARSPPDLTPSPPSRSIACSGAVDRVRAPLRYLEPATLAEEHGVHGVDTNILEKRLGVPVRRIVVSEHEERSNHRHARTSMGTRTMDCCLCFGTPGVPSGAVFP